MFSVPTPEVPTLKAVGAAPGGQRDPAVFEAWVAPHLRLMANLASRLVGEADRDDVVQDSLARAWLKWATYQSDRGSPQAWLAAIVADQARRTTRRRHRSATPERRGEAETTYDHDLEVAIRNLSKRQRLAVELHYFIDLSVADVARAMGCSQGTVKSTLFDARARLRSALGEE